MRVGLGIVGAVISTAIGLGPGIGFAVGATIGGYIDAKNNQQDYTYEGPRLTDRNVTVVSYGTPIAKVWATDRVPGNMIWAEPLEEVRNVQEEEIDGKGGGGSTQTTVTYTYFGLYAVGICEGEVFVQKVFADGKLIYDVSPESAQVEKYPNAMTIYGGTTTQPVDPFISSFEGTTITPAFLDLCYIVFKRLPLADFGNHLPNINAVVIKPAVTTPFYTIDTNGNANYMRASNVSLDQRYWVYPKSDFTGSAIVDLITRQIVREGPVDTSPIVGLVPDVALLDELKTAFTDDLDKANSSWAYRESTLPTAEFIAVWNASTWRYEAFINIIQVNAGSYVRVIENNQVQVPKLSNGNARSFRQCFAPRKAADMGFLPVLGGGTTTGENPGIIVCTKQSAIFYELPTSEHRGGDLDADGNLWSFGADHISSVNNVIRPRKIPPFLSVIEAGVVQSFPDIVHEHSRMPTGSDFLRNFVAYDAGTGNFVLAVNTWDGSVIANRRAGLICWHPSNGVIWYHRFSANLRIELDYFGVQNGVLYVVYDNRVIKVNAATGAFIDSSESAPIVFLNTNVDNFFVIQSIQAAVDTNASGTKDVEEFYFGRRGSTSIFLEEILREICVKSGLTLSQVNTANLPEGTIPVNGFSLIRQVNGAQAISMLRLAFFFDCAEIDGQVVFQRQDSATVGVIDADDLGAREVGDSGDVIFLEERVEQERELPRILEVLYVDISMVFQTNLQRAMISLGVVTTDDAVTVELPVVLTAAQAKNIAERNLRQAWMRRKTFEMRLPLNYIKYSPMDTLTLTRNGVTHTMKVLRQAFGENMLLEVEAYAERAQAHTLLTAGAASGSAPIYDSIGTAPTMIDVFNSPPLRDEDDVLGFYIAISPASTERWPGATVEISRDNGATWTPLISTGRQSVIGYVTNVLPPVADPTVVDEENFIDVTIFGGSLSSKTDQEIVANEQNAAMLGDEIVQYRTATLVGTNKYRLTGLYRARRGTEWAMPLHSLNERFTTAATTGLIPLDMTVSDLGGTFVFRATTFGSASISAFSEIIVLNDERKKPRSPVNIEYSFSGGDIILVWVRRARIGGEFVEGQDVPLDEAVEAYEIDFYVGTSFKRMKTASTPTVTYTAAEQSTDGITSSLPITAYIYQIGEFGRGHAGIIEINPILSGPLMGVGTLTVTASVGSVTASAALSGVGTLTATIDLLMFSALLQGVGTITAEATVSSGPQDGAALLQGVGTLTAIGSSGDIPGSGSLVGMGDAGDHIALMSEEGDGVLTEDGLHIMAAESGPGIVADVIP